MKKFFQIIIATIIAVAFTGCGSPAKSHNHQSVSFAGTGFSGGGSAPASAGTRVTGQRLVSPERTEASSVPRSQVFSGYKEAASFMEANNFHEEIAYPCQTDSMVGDTRQPLRSAGEVRHFFTEVRPNSSDNDPLIKRNGYTKEQVAYFRKYCGGVHVTWKEIKNTVVPAQYEDVVENIPAPPQPQQVAGTPTVVQMADNSVKTSYHWSPKFSLKVDVDGMLRGGQRPSQNCLPQQRVQRQVPQIRRCCPDAPQCVHQQGGRYASGGRGDAWNGRYYDLRR